MNYPPQEFYEAALVAIETAISPQRLARYFALAGGDKIAGVRLYERNTQLCEALYGVIQGFEVTLRNAFHQQLTAALGTAWYDSCGWKISELKMLQKAKEKTPCSDVDREEMQTPGRIVANLNFGFWTSLTSGRYLDDKWIPFLRHAFKYKEISRKEAFERLDSIRILRNRVAHHECVLERDLNADYEMLLEAIGWICPITAEWVRRTNCFSDRYVAHAPLTACRSAMPR